MEVHGYGRLWKRTRMAGYGHYGYGHGDGYGLDPDARAYGNGHENGGGDGDGYNSFASSHAYGRASRNGGGLGYEVEDEVEDEVEAEDAQKRKQEMTSETTKRPVVVTTEYRGIFFGYAGDTSGDTVVLSNARNCIFWSSLTGGFLGLTSEGPGDGSKIGAWCPSLVLKKVTSIADVTDAAVKKWTEYAIYRGN